MSRLWFLTVFDELIPSVAKFLTFSTVSSTAPAVDWTSNHDVFGPVCISSSSSQTSASACPNLDYSNRSFTSLVSFLYDASAQEILLYCG